MLYEVITRLRMFCTHPLLVGADQADPVEEMPKYQRLLELLEEIFSRDEKCLIFTSYTGMTDIFLNDLPRITSYNVCYTKLLRSRVSSFSKR